MEVESGSNIIESNILESVTKMSELSKSEAPINLDSNDLNLAIYKSQNILDNLKISSGGRRRITLKDLVFYLEGQKRTPLQNLILHKAIMKMSQ
jgi:hypothetical protein